MYTLLVILIVIAALLMIGSYRDCCTAHDWHRAHSGI